MKAFRDTFTEALDDDFNTGGAVGTLFDLLGALNRFADVEKLEAGPASPEVLADFTTGVGILREVSGILGLFWEPPAAASLGGGDELVAGLMQLVIDLRNNLRATAKGIADKSDPTKKALFEQTDLIRQRLAGLKVVLEDRPGGTTWRVG